MKVTYNVVKEGWAFDDYGREYWSVREYSRETIHLVHRPHNYSDAVDVLFMECDKEEAERVADEFNKAQPASPVAPVASVQEVPYGYFLIIREPYDD